VVVRFGPAAPRLSRNWFFQARVTFYDLSAPLGVRHDPHSAEGRNDTIS